MPRTLFRAGICCLLAVLFMRAAPAWSAAAPVTLADDGSTFTLANGLVTARIEKRSGSLVSLKYKGLELLGRASGKAYAYWSHDGGGSLGSSRASAIIVDPASNKGERAIVSCRFTQGQGGGTVAADVELRFALQSGATGLYVYAIWEHKPDYPPLRLGEARFTMKLNERIFDYMTIDAQRRQVMPTADDWNRGTPLNMKEARRLTTGVHAGKAEHKYDYSAIQFDTPAFGWSSTKEHVGLWIVNPTIEYLGGGPTKVELTGHLDVNAGAAPTLCNYWVGSHYGGSTFRVEKGEAWSKVVGPMLIHCNSAGTHEEMWQEALTKAAREAAAWPFEWAADSNYLGQGGRGSATGQINLADPLVSKDKIGNLLVGLTAPGNVDWQKDAKSYQFWVRAGKDGQFAIPKVRPGTYTLRAIADGVLGEFSRADVSVTAGQTTNLGTLTWRPVRLGRQLWEIGIPNRSAQEFKHGEHYWQWGLYNDYPKEFPNDVNFIIGKSDWSKDWNYAQPTRNGGGTTWSVTFDLPKKPRGTATLRFAICGSRGRGGIQVAVNDKPAGGTGPLVDSGVMHRDGIRGYWEERRVTFDAALLQEGTNVLKLTNAGRSWVDGVLYDYLRLELDEG